MSAPRETFELDIDPARVAEWLAEDPSLQVIDVREPYEWEICHVENSRHIPMRQIPSNLVALPRARARNARTG